MTCLPVYTNDPEASYGLQPLFSCEQQVQTGKDKVYIWEYMRRFYIRLNGLVMHEAEQVLNEIEDETELRITHFIKFLTLLKTS